MVSVKLKIKTETTINQKQWQYGKLIKTTIKQQEQQQKHNNQPFFVETLTIVKEYKRKQKKTNEKREKTTHPPLWCNFARFQKIMVFAATGLSGCSTVWYSNYTVPYTKYGNLSILSVWYCMETVPYSSLNMDKI